MTELRNRTALLTGASRGLGVYIARALAAEGMRLVLMARDADGLAGVASPLRAAGAEVRLAPGDVTRAEDRESAVAIAEEEFGGVDVLVNNAGVERMGRFHQLPASEVERLTTVNLLAPMLLTQRVLPGMVERRWGRVVNIASLAGKATPPYAEAYAATKAGLIAFTRSLRASYHDTGIGASSVIPGFVRDAGMYQRAVTGTARTAPALLGTSAPEAVARAVVRCVRDDVGEIIVNPTPVRPLIALSEIFPGLGGPVARAIGLDRLFAGWAEKNGNL